MTAPQDALAQGADSPYRADGSQFAFDSTSLGQFKTCPKLYEYSQLRGYRARHAGVDLDFGIWYHSAIERFHQAQAQGADHETAVAVAVAFALEATWDRELGRPWHSGDPNKNRHTLLRSIVWYLDHFREDAAKTVLLANGRAAVELSFRMAVGDDLLLCGHLDRLVEFGGSHFVMDLKTTASTVGPYYFERYSPDNQMSLYSLAARVIYHTPVSGVIVDAAQVAVGFTRFERGVVPRTEGQINEWLEDFYVWAAAARAATVAAHFPMNDKACSMYGGCVFRKVCSADPRIRQRILDSDFVQREWNPLRSR